MQQHPHHHSYDPLHLFEGEDEQQMSEAFRNSAFLALSGGFQDAYTYNVRNEVFSNAQTGNVVLMSQHLMAGEWMSGLRYLLPLISFALGVWVAEKIQGKYRYARKLHWRQGVLLAEHRSSFYRRFRAERTGYAGHDPGVLCLCHAGAEFP